jgi:hypothetical protein
VVKLKNKPLIPKEAEMEIAKGGWKMDRVRYSYAATELAVRLMAQRRPMLVLPEEAERGSRFYDNEAILARLEAHYTEVEFMACPGLTVDAMLIDAGKADWWYTNEEHYREDFGIEEGDDE